MGIDDTYMNDDDKDDKCRLIHQGKWFVFWVCVVNYKNQILIKTIDQKNISILIKINIFV